MLQVHSDTEQTLPDLADSLKIFLHVSIEDAPFLQDVSAKRYSDAWLFFDGGALQPVSDNVALL